MNIIGSFEAIVGKDNVLTDDSVLSVYGGERSFVVYEKPLAVVKVHSGQEAEAVVNLALQESIPLVPVSSGGRHTSPASAPSVPGAVIVDLSEMKKIISINRAFCIAVIEPGVTYEELLPALAEEGLTINMPLSPKKNKSVVADLLEVNPRRNAATQWNYIDPMRCTEVTFGDGNRQFTGEAGGGALDLEKQQAQGKWQINGAGPMMLDFGRILAGSQGTMGIVTWMSVKCEPLETVKKNYVVRADSFDALRGFAHEVLKWRFADGLFLLNGEGFRRLVSADAPAAPWQAVVEIAGREILPQMRVDQQESDISDLALKYGLKMFNAENIYGSSLQMALNRNVQSDGAAQNAARLFFVTTLAEVQEFESVVKNLAAGSGYPAAELGIYVQPLHQGTSVQVEFWIPFNESSKAAAKTLFDKASKACAERHGYFARPYGTWADIAYAKDAESASLLSRLYEIFNPKGILNPGKLLAGNNNK